jgi:hypothetical protein
MAEQIIAFSQALFCKTFGKLLARLEMGPPRNRPPTLGDDPLLGAGSNTAEPYTGPPSVLRGAIPANAITSTVEP